MHFHVMDHLVKYPLAQFGLTGEIWGINIETVTSTWAAMCSLIILAFGVRIAVGKYKNSVVSFCARTACKFVKQSVEESLGTFDKDVFCFIFGLFLFTLSCNFIGIIPFFGEPTADINSALALGCSSFGYVQYQGLKYKGLKYFNKFFSPIFIMFPLNIIQQIAKIASLSFRLFGNILGDTIIWTLLLTLFQKGWFIYIPLCLISLLFLYCYKKFDWSTKYPTLNPFASFCFGIISILAGAQCYFGIFQGFVQAYVISLLTNMYIATERSNGGGH